MLFKKERNPVYELQKDLDKERVLLGYLDEEGKFETDDKIRYSLIEKIFNEGITNTKKVSKASKVMWGFWGFVGGACIMMILFFARILKP